MNNSWYYSSYNLTSTNLINRSRFFTNYFVPLIRHIYIYLYLTDNMTVNCHSYTKTIGMDISFSLVKINQGFFINYCLLYSDDIVKTDITTLNITTLNMSYLSLLSKII